MAATNPHYKSKDANEVMGFYRQRMRSAVSSVENDRKLRSPEDFARAFGAKVK